MGKIVFGVRAVCGVPDEDFTHSAVQKRKLEGGMETAFQKVGGIGG
jgi:hypothetical protein